MYIATISAYMHILLLSSSNDRTTSTLKNKNYDNRTTMACTWFADVCVRDGFAHARERVRIFPLKSDFRIRKSVWPTKKAAGGLRWHYFRRYCPTCRILYIVSEIRTYIVFVKCPFTPETIRYLNIRWDLTDRLCSATIFVYSKLQSYYFEKKKKTIFSRKTRVIVVFLFILSTVYYWISLCENRPEKTSFRRF